MPTILCKKKSANQSDKTWYKIPFAEFFPVFGQPVNSPQHRQGVTGKKKENKMQIVSSFLQFYSPFFPNVYSCFLRVSGRTCSNTIVLSRCQEVKFIFSIISGQTAQTEENDVWGQMLKTWVLCSLNSKSKELTWKADNVVTVFLYGNFSLEERWEWKEDGFQVPNSFGFKLSFDQLLPDWVPLEKLNSTSI